MTGPTSPTTEDTTAVLANTLRAVEFAHQAGITYRQLDHWTTAGYLTARPRRAARSGHLRRYDPADLDRARFMGALARLGVRLDTAADLAADLAEDGIADMPDIGLRLSLLL